MARRRRRNPAPAIPWWAPIVTGFGLIGLSLVTPIPDEVGAIPLGLALITGGVGAKAING